jgi:hypothetical protein
LLGVSSLVAVQLGTAPPSADRSLAALPAQAAEPIVERPAAEPLNSAAFQRRMTDSIAPAERAPEIVPAPLATNPEPPELPAPTIAAPTPLTSSLSPPTSTLARLGAPGYEEVNLRREPGRTAPVLAVLRAGIELELLGDPVPASDLLWQQVRLPDTREGWVTTEALTRSEAGILPGS